MTLLDILTTLQALPPEKLTQKALYFDFNLLAVGTVTGIRPFEAANSPDTLLGAPNEDQMKDLPLILTLGGLGRHDAAEIFNLPDLADDNGCPCENCRVMREADAFQAEKDGSGLGNYLAERKKVVAQIRQESNIEATSLAAAEWDFLTQHLVDTYGSEKALWVMSEIERVPTR